MVRVPNLDELEVALFALRRASLKSIASNRMVSFFTLSLYREAFKLPPQVASLVIANTRALEAQVERAQEDSTLAKDAADLASGKCGALAAELVKLSKQLTGGTKERRCAATAS